MLFPDETESRRAWGFQNVHCTEILHSSLKATQQIPHATAGLRYCTQDKQFWAGSPLILYWGKKKVSTVSASRSSNKEIILCSHDRNELNHGLLMNCSLLGLRDKSHLIQPSQGHRHSRPALQGPAVWRCRAKDHWGSCFMLWNLLFSRGCSNSKPYGMGPMGSKAGPAAKSQSRAFTWVWHWQTHKIWFCSVTCQTRRGTDQIWSNSCGNNNLHFFWVHLVREGLCKTWL